ncbi:hypothetical protein BDW72DRAFT_194672 [Aspergillus terricola var. indicus]
MEICGMIESTEERDLYGELPRLDEEEKDNSCDDGYGNHWYDDKEDKDRQPDLIITGLDAHNTYREVVNIHAADNDSLVSNPPTLGFCFIFHFPKLSFKNFKCPCRVQSSGWIAYANHLRLATTPSETRSFAAEASQTTPFQTAIANGTESMTNHTSPYSSSSSPPILHSRPKHGFRQVKDIAAVLEEREKQIIDEGIILEKQYAELRQKLIAHAEGFMEVRRKLADLQAKAFNRTERVKEVERLREEFGLCDNELCPD